MRVELDRACVAGSEVGKVIILFFAGKIETDEPALVLYAAAVELLLDSFVIGLIFQMA